MDALDEALRQHARAWVADHRNEIGSGHRNPWTVADGYAWSVAMLAERALADALEDAGLR